MYRYFISFYVSSPTPPAAWNMASGVFDYSKEIDSSEDIIKVSKLYEDNLEGHLKGMKVVILFFQLLKVVAKG
jgi:hypothetical protein